MMFPSWRDWVFSAKAFLASMMALYIALWFDLPRPYWAMAAVYVVANPLAGATSSKGLYRALGTIIGASAAVFFVPLFVNAPELLALVVALWTGCLLYISMLDRTPRSYVFMLAGYSLPLIALPTVGTPELIFDTAVARTEEIIIGITCATLVGLLIFPSSVGTVVGGRITDWLDDAADWANEILRGEGAIPATPARRQKLAADIAGLDLIISQLSFDAGTRDVARHARELRGRLMMLLPLFSSLADRLHALKSGDRPLPAKLGSLLHEVADWLQSPDAASADAPQRFARTIEELKSADRSENWDHLILSSALARLLEIINLWHDCLALREQIARGQYSGRWRPTFRHRQVVGRTRYYDYAMMLFSSGSVVVATLVASLIWIETGWQSGAGFVMMTAVACSFFAAMDQPAPFIFKMFLWCGVSLIAAFVYQFAILPAISGYEMLVLVFAPSFLLIGLLIPRPQFNMLAMLLTVNTASFVAMQNRLTVDFASFANEAIAAMAGIAFALIWTQVARPFGAEIAARRLVRAGWSDLAETAAGLRRSDHEKLAGRMLDRMGQLVPRLAALEDRYLSEIDGFAEVRLGFNIVAIQRARRHLDGDGQSSVNAVLSGIADLFRQRVVRREAVAPDARLQERIDQALSLPGLQQTMQGRSILDALVGLRRALFPYAPSPKPMDGEIVKTSSPQMLMAAE
ncbi:FUSC family protein [Phyllobacterium pellucidum]|uniref:FUSC family protein n=1 Tax=Phyllobacterium pellucidum TaxID=2740464 RepID=UPI001D13467E|nr:FUSC family protein [Phyllobacterium sp. T1018]UGY11611.1 FUSC family protein [Phyllobacterium sp. T1018]